MSITLKCTVTGKEVTWHNKQIIAKKIKQYGSEAALRAAYVCREAKTKHTGARTRSGLLVPRDGDITSAMKAIMLDGIRLGGMTREEYNTLMEQAMIKNTMVA